ncbi:phosphate transport system permease protein PstA [Bacteroidia bacterium]|nr:phosphate transport system permease protein PstA [Bacteroidia bacterium]GHV20149.1 phosphate transport system permease protein PstA [Bacteroidia bacterium]
MKFKFIEEKIVNLLMILATLIVFGFFASIIWTIAKTGFPSLTWEMISRLPGGGFYLGKEGGILNAIIGSLMIVFASTVLGLIISIPVVFYINVYLKKTSRLAYFTRLSFDVLFGIPSIVYGAFAFTIMIFFGLKTSLLGGIIVITLLIIPIFVRSMDEVAKSVSKELLDATYSLGATKLETCKVVIRQIAPGIATATLLSIGRAIGDAAGVLFTAGFTDNIPGSPNDPVATLPLSVFFQLSSPIPEVRERAYAAALLLTIIVLILSIAGRLITRRFSKNRIK